MTVLLSSIAQETKWLQGLFPLFAEPAPPVPFRWLADSGQMYSIRPEKRGQNTYWYMKKRVNGRNHNIYLGPAGKLSAETLTNAVNQIEAS